MKKIFGLLLAGTAVMSLAACGSKAAPAQTGDGGVVTKITKPVELQFGIPFPTLSMQRFWKILLLNLTAP